MMIVPMASFTVPMVLYAIQPPFFSSKLLPQPFPQFQQKTVSLQELARAPKHQQKSDNISFLIKNG